ncbi:hypothetical protein EDB80DRAFT_675912 [Ilyonectria destructans]|nr:hypothetical protein EDB80DRAFT_675912 [Ilyonectria destructans]
MILTIGEHKDSIDPWLSLIPNEYGLCVVKSAVALLLMMAEKHSNKRMAIFGAFIEVRDIIGECNSKGIHFQTEPNVYRHAVLSTSRFRKKEKPPDPQTILQPAKEKAKALVIAVDNCRDASIKTIEKDSKSVLTETRVVRWEVVQSLWEMARARNELNSKLLEMLLEQHKNTNAFSCSEVQITIPKLEAQRRQELKGQNEAMSSRLIKSYGTVISFERLSRVPTAPSPEEIHSSGDGPVNLTTLQSRGGELGSVLRLVSKFDTRT